MKKRTLALFLAVVMILSVCAMGVQANAAEEKYRVGYSIQDMNPWKNPQEPSEGLMSLDLAGRGGNDIGRIVTGIFNDDGDKNWYGYYLDEDDGKKKVQGNNVIDPDDGLKTTCTAITDTNNNTVLFITLDTLGAFSNLTNDARVKIIESIENNPAKWRHSQYGFPNISPNGITLSGSHTHSSIRLSDYGPYMENPTKDADKYYKYVVDQIVLAAQKAWTDSAYATMYKNTVDVSEVLDANRADVNAKFADMHNATSMQLNFVRHWNHHYVATYADSEGKATENIIKDANGNQMIFDVVAGSNFGTTAGVKNYVSRITGIPVNKIAIKAYYAKNPTTASDKGRDRGPLTSKNGTDVPADDRLHLIEFQFADSRKPVVMVNWRAHTTENGGYYGAVSSDYAGALRSVMASKYRVAFFLGAAGNLTINFANSSGPFLTPWRAADYYNGNYTSGPNRRGVVGLYAELLAYAADTVLGKKVGKMPAGEIHVTSSQFAAERQINTDAQIKAVEELINKYRVRKSDNKTFDTDTNTRDIPWKKSWTYYPYVAEDGVTVINSYFEAGTIAGRCSETVTVKSGKEMVTLAPKYGEDTYSYITLSAISLGNNTAFVTAPFELADRYYDNPENGDLTANAWKELEALGFETPFVLSCTNGYVSYLPSSIEYLYNTDKFVEYFNQAHDGSTIFGAGSYESHISPYASGAGEEMIDQFAGMLTSLRNNTYAKPEYCDICEQEVFWQPINNEKLVSVDSGHYYLTDDVKKGLTNTVGVGCTLHFELNGHKYEVNDKAFHLNNTSTLNITDSVGGGEIVSHVADTVRGTAIVTATSATLNLYGGTLSCDATPFEENPAARTVFNLGTFNMYGGTIKGGKVISGQANSNYHDGCGATVYMGPKGNLNVYSGAIISGDAEVAGNCVYLSAVGSKIKLSGNAHIDEIYVKEYNDEHSQLTVEGGTANLVFESDLKSGDQIGKGSDASGLNVIKPEGVRVHAELGALILDSSKLVAQNGNVGYYDLNTALLTYKSGEIQLLDNVTDDVFAYNNAIIDLNGFDITGKVTVPEDKTIYCKDSATDDYDIEDDVYGKISVYTGDIQPVRAGMSNADKDYLKVTENDGISFHCVNLKLTHVTLTPEKASIKYKAAFEGDRLVAENVKQFGIAFNLRENPNATNMVEGTYSKFYTFAPGANANGTKASTSVIDIMQITQTEYINGKNAKMPIYGSAYVLTKDGEYLFGEAANKTFRQVVQDVDARWNSWEVDQRAAVVEMYKRFEGNMKYWGLSNIPQAAAQ